MVRDNWRHWLADVLVGGVVGGVLGVVAALNMVIYLGVEGGYEAGLGDVFDFSPLAGVLVVAVLVGGPVLGVTMARRRRHKRDLEKDHAVMPR